MEGTVALKPLNMMFWLEMVDALLSTTLKCVTTIMEIVAITRELEMEFVITPTIMKFAIMMEGIAALAMWTLIDALHVNALPSLMYFFHFLVVKLHTKLPACFSHTGFGNRVFWSSFCFWWKDVQSCCTDQRIDRQFDKQPSNSRQRRWQFNVDQVQFWFGFVWARIQSHYWLQTSWPWNLDLLFNI